MIAVDSSVVVAGFASWSEQHGAATEVLNHSARLVAHSGLEAYSVLTRLPQPHRAPAGLVAQYLLEQFTDPWLTLSPSRHRRVLSACSDASIAGGATYDALIAWTAQAHGASLATCDPRAAATYSAVGVDVISVG